VIFAGRHPLCELLAPGRFIDNDTQLGALSGAAAADTPAAAAAGGIDGSDPGPRMLLITGPNASGKSVYMKQVSSAGLSFASSI
jgi:DNA mismatch repair ATPase MutS